MMWSSSLRGFIFGGGRARVTLNVQSTFKYSWGGVLTTTMVFLREKNGTTVPGILKDEDVEKRVVVGK